MAAHFDYKSLCSFFSLNDVNILLSLGYKVENLRLEVLGLLLKLRESLYSEFFL